ncbi:MAG: citrate synthase [Flavobacteriales bacterium]|jgi:citrate synthase
MKPTKPPSNEITSESNFIYVNKTETKICYEVPSDSNPYVNKASYMYGYSSLELVKHKSYAETLLLLFSGELPSVEKTALVERLFIALMNLGPRHPAVRAAMVAGVSKTNSGNLLPIGLNVLSGEHNGAQEVEAAVIFIQKNFGADASKVVADTLLNEATSIDRDEGELHLYPGFGNQYGSIDEHCRSLAEVVFGESSDKRTPYIHWVKGLCQALAPHDLGLLKTGMAAAVMCELGIPAREAGCLFQLACAPGIAAHGLEQTHKPITAIPMLDDAQHKYIRRKDDKPSCHEGQEEL